MTLKVKIFFYNLEIAKREKDQRSQKIGSYLCDASNVSSQQEVFLERDDWLTEAAKGAGLNIIFFKKHLRDLDMIVVVWRYDLCTYMAKNQNRLSLSVEGKSCLSYKCG
jgi:hypothetical protein